MSTANFAILRKLSTGRTRTTYGLAQYAGNYGADIVVSWEDSRFCINTSGGGKIPLVAHSENNFTMEGTGVDFVRDEKGAVTAMIQHWVEGDRYFPRKK